MHPLLIKILSMLHNGFDMMLHSLLIAQEVNCQYLWIFGETTIVTLFVQIILKYTEISKFSLFLVEI